MQKSRCVSLIIPLSSSPISGAGSCYETGSDLSSSSKEEEDHHNGNAMRLSYEAVPYETLVREKQQKKSSQGSHKTVLRDKAIGLLTSFFPPCQWIPRYRWPFLKGDLLSGITVGVMGIPQGMAYALIAGTLYPLPTMKWGSGLFCSVLIF